MSKSLKITIIVIVALFLVVITFPVWAKPLFSSTRLGYSICTTIGQKKEVSFFEYCEIGGHQFDPPWTQE